MAGPVQGAPARRLWRLHPVILVLLGTNPYSFERLARAVDELAGRKGWDVFMQTGHTPYAPAHCRHAAFLPHDDVLKLAGQCDFMIVQGGAGSIHEGLAAGKPVIAVPRQPERGESQDRQADLVEALAARGCVVGVRETAQLEAAVETIRNFRPARPPDNHVPQLVRNYLETLA